jgi:hypothetical protein
MVKNYLGLPIRAHDFVRDVEKGGSLGSQADLAQAVLAAIADGPPKQKLIINLSVGWHPVHQAVPPTSLSSWKPGQSVASLAEYSIGADAVRSSLARASCAGALVMAAAGNAIGADRAGPLLPAAWEAQRAPVWEPGPNGCRERFSDLAPPPPVVDISPRPLVFAVTAVDHEGGPLPTTRTAAVAPRAALGLNVTTRERRGGYTQLYSGTSMAAAVASAVAGRFWQTHPSDSSWQVAQRLPYCGCRRIVNTEIGAS